MNYQHRHGPSSEELEQMRQMQRMRNQRQQVSGNGSSSDEWDKNVYASEGTRSENVQTTEDTHSSHDHADTCTQCANVCLKTASHYMNVENHDHDLLKQLLVCAEVCKLCALSQTMCSPNCCDVMQLCSKVCADCAKACSAHPGDECMYKCASTCADCSECCRKAT